MTLKWENIIPLVFVWLWSTGFVGAKYGLPYIEPYFLLFTRFVITLVIFICIMQILKAKRINITEAAGQILVGILLHGAYLGGVFFAINEGVPAGITAIIVGLQPILTVSIGRIWLGQSVNKAQLIGLSLGFFGVSMVIIGNDNMKDISFEITGLIACVIALFSISIGTIIQKRLGQNLPLITSSTFQYLGAAIVMAILTFSMETQYVEYSFTFFAAMIWLIFGLSITAILLLMYMIKQGEMAKVASYFYLVPPVTVIETWFLFDEKLGVIAIIGCILSVYGVFLVISKSKS